MFAFINKRDPFSSKMDSNCQGTINYDEINETVRKTIPKNTVKNTKNHNGGNLADYVS